MTRSLTAVGTWMWWVMFAGIGCSPDTHARESAQVSPERPPVGLFGVWSRVYPPSPDTLIVQPAGVASGPPARANFGRTTRWSYENDMGRGMFCLGDEKHLQCVALRLRGDTLSLGDVSRSTYRRVHQ